MDYQEILENEGVIALNEILSASSLRKMTLSTIDIDTCGPRMQGETKIIRESDESDCGKIVWGELKLCSQHFNELQEKMKEEGKLIWQW